MVPVLLVFYCRARVVILICPDTFQYKRSCDVFENLLILACQQAFKIQQGEGAVAREMCFLCPSKLYLDVAEL